MTEQSTIATRLRQIRKDLRLSQYDIATLTKVSLPTWQNYEYGKNTPSSKVLEILSEKGYSIDWIINNNGFMKKSTSVKEQINPFQFNNNQEEISQTEKEEIFKTLKQSFDDIYNKIKTEAQNKENIIIPEIETATLAFRETLTILSIAKSSSEIDSLIKLTIEKETTKLLELLNYSKF